MEFLAAGGQITQKHDLNRLFHWIFRFFSASGGRQKSALEALLLTRKDSYCFHSGKVSACKVPDMSNVKWSKPQKEHRQRFKQAVEDAKAAMADPQLHLKYEKIAAKKASVPSTWRSQTTTIRANSCSKSAR